MKILDIFKKKVKPTKVTIPMEKKELVNEHRDLVKILKSGSKKERMSEAKEQGSELKRYLKGKK